MGDAGDSSVPFSPNRVQAGHSQDVPEEGSLFHVSPVSPGFLSRPSRAAQQFPPDGVPLPTTLDDFSDSVLGDPITYAQCEQIPGSDTPMSLPVYSLLSGSAYMPGQSSVQTVLASGTSSRVRRWGPLPSRLRWIWRTAHCWRRACKAVRIGSRRTVDSRSRMGIQRLACSFITRGSWSSSVRRSRLACYAVNLQRDAGIMLSNLQILLQFATSLHRMSSEMMVLGIGQMVFPQAEVADLSPAPRAARAAKYMSAMGLWRPQMGPGDPGPVPASSCYTCMTCECCFPEDQLPPG